MARATTARLIATAALACAAFAGACQVIGGIDYVDKVEPEAAAPIEAGVDAFRDPCSHEGLPEKRPTDAGAPILPPFVLAVSDFQFGAKRSDGTPIGFDIDNSCTCEERKPTANDAAVGCVPRASAITADLCDTDGGVDNQVLKVAGPLAANFGTDIDRISRIDEFIKVGRAGLLLHIAGWDGTPNDDNLTVGFIASPGLYDHTGCEATPPPDGGFGPEGGPPYVPRWCGKDKWAYDPAFTSNVVERIIAPARAVPAYVVDGVLSFQTELLPLFFGEVLLNVRSARVAGNLLKSGDKVTLTNAVVGGRATPQDFFGGFALVVLTTSMNERFCRRPEFEIFRQTLCDNLDLPSEGGASAPCGEISLGFQFAASSAAFGEPREAGLPNLGTCDAAILRCP